jgi:hypothetical protein
MMGEAVPPLACGSRSELIGKASCGDCRERHRRTVSAAWQARAFGFSGFRPAYPRHRPREAKSEMPSGPSTTASPSMTNEVVRSRSAASTMHQITRNSPSDERTYTTKHGTVATMDTSNIGKPAVAPFDPAQFRGLGRPSAVRRQNPLQRCVAHLVSCRGTSTPSAAYSVILFRNVRTDTPSKRADAVRFPSVLTSVSKIRSCSISRMGTPTNQRARRRRDAQEIGVWGEKRPMCVLHSNSAPRAPSSADYKTTIRLILY